MNDPKLNQALKAVDEAFQTPELPDLGTMINEHMQTLSNARQQAMADIESAEQTIVTRERQIERIDRLRRAYHAANTELTRP